MLEALFDTIKDFLGMSKRSVLHDNLKFTFRTLEEQVIPALESFSSDDSKSIKTINKSTLLTNFIKSCGVKSKDNIHGIEIICNFFKEVLKYEKQIDKLIDKAFDDAVTDKTITAKQAAIMKLINDINGMQSFILDFIYYAINDKHGMPKIKTKSIQKSMPSFAGMYKAYSKNFEQYVKDLEKVSNEPIGDQADSNNIVMLDKRIAQSGAVLDIPVSNFCGNPIYHYRMWLVDKDIKKLESLKEKRQLIELRLIELRLEEKNDKDSNVSKQIQYYEDKLADIEYKISKLEN